MIKPFGQDLSDIKAYGNDVVKVMAFGEEAWSRQTTIPDYLCFTALEAGTFTLTIPAAVTTANLSYVEYSLDGVNWVKTDNSSSEVVITTPTIAQGGKVYWRGSGVRMTQSHTAANNASRFSSTGRFDLSGHLLSLLKGDNYESTTGIGSYTFCNLFYPCTGIVHAHDLVIPLLNEQGMFFRLFRGCTSLVSAPSLPQTEIPSWGFREMFYECTLLPTIANMVATTFGNTCCQAMYQGCTSLTSVTLPTPTSYSGTGQFQLMFYNCSNLSYVKFLATDISTENCTNNWLSGVSSTGTFIQASGVSWASGASGIPTNWLSVNDGATFPNNATACDYIFNSSSATGAQVEIGTISGINEPFEVTFKATEIVSSDRVVAGYTGADGNTTPKQGSMSYFYLRNNPDSFQHQIYRLNTSSDSLASTNGLLQSNRDLNKHTGKVFYTYNGTDGNWYRSLIFDGVLKMDAATIVHPYPKVGVPMYIFGHGSSRFVNGIIYGMKWYNEDGITLKADLVPCTRNSDSAAGFWDKTRLQFFTSSYWSAGFEE